MVICPLLRSGRGDYDPESGREYNNGCMEDDCGFFSRRSDRCAISAMGDLADVYVNDKKGY